MKVIKWLRNIQHISLTCHCHMPLPFPIDIENCLIYMKMISHTLNSILDNCNKRFIPWFTSSSYQLQCMQDLKLIRVTSKYMKNVLIYQFDPTPNWYVQKIKIRYGRIWKTNMIFLFDPYSINDLVLFILSYEWEISILLKLEL